MQLHLFHSNDIHSHFGNWYTIEKLIRSMKIKYGDCMCYVDVGDHIDRSHTYTEALFGKGNVQMLNDIGVNVVTIGNNEGITLSKAQLIDLYSEANFDIVVSNLYNNDGKRPSFVKPYSIQQVGNYKIGFIAATAEYPLYYELLGWQITSPLFELKKYAEEIRHQVDVLVCLSHLGQTIDDEICQQISEIDIVLGAHTHHYFKEGKWVNGTLQAAAGRYGDWLGHITIDIDNYQKRWHAELIDINQLGAQEDDVYLTGKIMLQDKITSLSYSLSADLLHACEMSYLLAESLSQFSQIPAVIINSGLLVHNLPRGEVTRYDILRCLPHPINPAIVTLSGAKLIETLKIVQCAEYRNQEVSGMGFRGTNFGDYVTLNLSYGELGYYYQDQLIEPDKIYQLITVDMYTFGRYFPEFINMDLKYLLPEFLRDIFGRYLQEIHSN